MKSLLVIATFAAGIAVSNAFADTSTITAPKGKVLLVASSANELTFKDGRRHATGYYLSELAVPARKFLDAGYEVVVATPDGNTPALDANSITAELFENNEQALAAAMKFVTTYPGMQKPKRLGEIVQTGLDGFEGIYVPGGHAPMVDLMQDADLGAALKQFHATGKATGLLCHGPIALASAVADPAKFRSAMVAGDNAAASKAASGWIYDGYSMTVYSTAEEKPVEAFLGGKIQFYMEDALRAAGGKVRVGAPNEPYIVEDRELVTGQNPVSDHLIADAMVRKLDAQVSQRQASAD